MTTTISAPPVRVERKPKRKAKRRASKKKASVRSLQGLAPLRALIALSTGATSPRIVHDNIKVDFPSYNESPKTIYKHLNSLVRHGFAKRSRDRKHYSRTKAGTALLASLTIK